MTWAISRDDRITQLRQLLHERSATLANLTPGTPSHIGLQRECDAIWSEIQQLQNSTNVSPKAVLAALGVLALLLWSLLH